MCTRPSAKDKRFAEMRATVDEFKNKIKINDWMALQSLFDKFNKQLDKIMRSAEVGSRSATSLAHCIGCIRVEGRAAVGTGAVRMRWR
jgi:hypothetical protein